MDGVPRLVLEMRFPPLDLILPIKVGLEVHSVGRSQRGHASSQPICRVEMEVVLWPYTNPSDGSGARVSTRFGGDRAAGVVAEWQLRDEEARSIRETEGPLTGIVRIKSDRRLALSRVEIDPD